MEDAPIKFECETCGKSLKVKARGAGRTIDCPGCGMPTKIPGGRISALAKIQPPAEPDGANELRPPSWPPTRQVPPPPPPKPAPRVMNAANFERIHEGMTLEEVVAIVGPPTAMTSSSEFAGVKTSAHLWMAGIFANATVVFQNGGMVSKMQFGLR